MIVRKEHLARCWFWLGKKPHDFPHSNTYSRHIAEAQKPSKVVNFVFLVGMRVQQTSAPFSLPVIQSMTIEHSA